MPGHIKKTSGPDPGLYFLATPSQKLGDNVLISYNEIQKISRAKSYKLDKLFSIIYEEVISYL